MCSIVLVYPDSRPRCAVASISCVSPDPGVCNTVGMGEPLANYKRVVNAVRRITSPAPDGLGISQRNVVVSTVGAGQ